MKPEGYEANDFSYILRILCKATYCGMIYVSDCEC